MSSFLEHPLLKPQTVDKRLFQLDLAANALKASSLIVVPTGLGKTVIALMVLLLDWRKARFSFWLPPSLWWSSMLLFCAGFSKTRILSP